MWDDERVCARVWMDGRLIGLIPRRVVSCRRPFIHPYVPVWHDIELLHIRLERLLQRLFSAEEGSAPSSPTAPAAAAMGPMVPAAAGTDDAVKDEKPVKAIEESGGAAAAAAATVPSVAAAVAATAAAAAVKPEVSRKPEV